MISRLICSIFILAIVFKVILSKTMLSRVYIVLIKVNNNDNISCEISRMRSTQLLIT